MLEPLESVLHVVLDLLSFGDRIFSESITYRCDPISLIVPNPRHFLPASHPSHPQVAAIAFEVEKCCRENRLDDARAKHPELEAAIYEVFVPLRAYLDKNK